MEQQSILRLFKSKTDKSKTSEDVAMGISLNEINVSNIKPNQFQPRTNFDDEKIVELASTLAEHGMIQPIVVRKLDNEDNMYEIIAGERRFRAAKKLGWEKVPVVVNNLSDNQSAAIALIENLQREELSSIEEAQAYEKLLKIYEITQEALATNLGVSQSTIANKLRLLKLPNSIQMFVVEKKITERHARALIALKDEQQQLELIEEIVNKPLTVLQTEEKIKKIIFNDKLTTQPKPIRKILNRNVRVAFNTIRQSIGLIKQHGIEVETNESEFDDRYEVVVIIPKKR